MTTIVDVAAHQLVDPDPEGELALMEEMVASVVTTIHKVATNLGSKFDHARRMLGFRVALGRPAADIVAALRSVCEIGVALFQRGMVGPDATVTLSLAGTTVEVPGGVTNYTSAPRWADTFAIALVLRDQAALDSLCSFDAGSFEGRYDAYQVTWVRAMIAMHRGGDAGALLATAREEADAAKVFPEIGRRIGVPMIAVAQVLLDDDPEAFNHRLAEALDWYRTIHERPDFSHEAAEVLPLRVLGLSALAHDRGIPVRVRSGYLPPWLIDGSFKTSA